MKGTLRQSQQQRSLQSGPLVGTDQLIDAVGHYVPIPESCSRRKQNRTEELICLSGTWRCRGPVGLAAVSDLVLIRP